MASLVRCRCARWAPPPLRGWLPARASSTSVVDELLSDKPSPVPLGDGELLLYEGGWTTKKTILAGSLGAGAAWAYAGLNCFDVLRTPETALMSPTVATGFAAFAGLVTAMSYGGARAAMRAAVLTRDGQFLRLYPYSPLFAVGGGTAAPVTVPLKLFTLSSSGARRPFTGVDATTVNAGIGGSVMQLTFDKPAAAVQWVGSEGSGLEWGPRGLLGTAPAQPAAPRGSGAAAAAPAAAPAALLTPAAMYALPTAQRDALRRYALLVLALRGLPLDARRAASGDWELEAMVEQLDKARGRRPADVRVDELRYWRRAREERGGREYWYNLLTWGRQWVPPTVDGRGPAEWHPDLFPAGAAA